MTYTARSLHVTLLTPFDEATTSVRREELVTTAQRTVFPGPAATGGLPITPIVNAEAGEIYSLDRDELAENVRAVVDSGVGPVVAGTAGRTSHEAVAIARDAIERGAQALFVLPPYGSSDITISWNAARYPGVIVDYLRRLIDAVGDIPLVIHPTGPRTPEYGIGWPVETVRAVLAAIPTVAGWKMTYSYEGYRRIARLLRSEAPHVAVLPASAVRFHENLANEQLDGACSGSFCYALQPMLEHIRLWRAGAVAEAAKRWQAGLAALHEYVYADYSRLHVRYKLAAWLATEISSPMLRDPMPQPVAEEAATLRDLLTATGIAVRDGSDVDAYFGKA